MRLRRQLEKKFVSLLPHHSLAFATLPVFEALSLKWTAILVKLPQKNLSFATLSKRKRHKRFLTIEKKQKRKHERIEREHVK